MADPDELRLYAEVLHHPATQLLAPEQSQELVQKGILAALEEISAQAAGDETANQLVYETAASHLNENIRGQAIRILTRLAQEGQHQAVDRLYLLAVEKNNLGARQAILSQRWEPTRPALRALFDWFTCLASGEVYPADRQAQITQAYFQIASAELQQRLLASAAENQMKNWARIVSALQDGSPKGMLALVDGYTSFSGGERQLAIDQLEYLALQGSRPAQETLCRLFIEHDDAQAHRIALKGGFAPDDAEQRALFFFLAEDWHSYSRLDFDHSLLTNAYENSSRPQRRRLMEHSRKTGQTEWLRGLGQAGEVRWPNDLTDADWELAARRLLEAGKKQDLWRLSQAAPPYWSANLLERLANTGWTPKEEGESAGFQHLADLAHDCNQNPLVIAPKKALHTLSADIACIALHPAGKLLAAGSSDQRISLWDLPDGDLRMEPLLTPVPATRALALSPNGELIACASSDHRIRVFNLRSGQMLKTLEGHQAMIRSLLIHPNGRLLFSASFDGQIRIWRFPSGPELKVLQPGTGEIFGLALGNNGQALVSGGTDGLVRVWTVPEGIQTRQMSAHTGTVTHLSASAGSEMVASAGRDERICLWNSSSGGLVREIQNQSGPVTSFCLHPNDQVLISGHQNGSICLWNLSSGKTIGQLSSHHALISGLALTHDGHTLYSADIQGKLLAWDLRTFLTIRLAERASQPGAAAELQERLKYPHLSTAEKIWLAFSAELARWKQRYDIELSDFEPVQTGEFDIELFS